jgi:hypothetical protein
MGFETHTHSELALNVRHQNERIRFADDNRHKPPWGDTSDDVKLLGPLLDFGPAYQRNLCARAVALHKIDPRILEVLHLLIVVPNFWLL